MARQLLDWAMPDAAQSMVPRLPLEPPSPISIRWFCPWGYVADHGGDCRVVVGGTMLGVYGRDDDDRGPRNVLMVTLAQEPSMHFGHLAAAFGVGDEYLRVLRRSMESQGWRSILLRKMRTRVSKVTAEQQRELRAWFGDGVNPSDAFRRQRRRRDRLSRATISRERTRWQAEQIAEAAGASVTTAMAASETTTLVIRVEASLRRDASGATASQLPLFSESSSNEEGVVAVVIAGRDEAAPSSASEAHAHAQTMIAVDDAVMNDAATNDATTNDTVPRGAAADDGVDGGAGDTTADDEHAPIVPLRSRPVQSKRLVQHLGTWLMMAIAQQHGLHEAAATCGLRGDGSRIALDATIGALAIGQRCVEGVRRLQTPTVTSLLRCDHAPTATGVRRRLHRLADEGGAALVSAMSSRYIADARGTADVPAVFYVDNHFRPYSGQEVVRKGWRMQDRRVLPGTSDYYVHDEDGRPVFRVDVTSHDSLTQWLMPIADRLRAGLGADERILLAFDRGGAFAEYLAALRDKGFEFVTYERKPYPLLPVSAFDRTIRIRDEEYGVHESRLKNLGKGRGRLRRIALLSADGAQINLVAISTLPLERLVAILVGDEAKTAPSGRWQQENAFKHGVERWGINQLDGRRVDDYPPDTIIPNPARRRLDRAVRLARAEEGAARNALARVDADSPRRERVEHDLHHAIQRRVDLELLRAWHPAHAPLADTELAGKLVRHTGELKAVVDTIRIVCANVETELAATIAPALGTRRAAEAKKVIANLLAAPGRVDVTLDAIRVRLAPAANRAERAAITDLLEQVNQWNLTLPGDAQRRPLQFGLQPV